MSVARTLSFDPSCQPHVWLLPVKITSLPVQSPMPLLAAGCQRKPVDREPEELVQVTPFSESQFPPLQVRRLD